jgi:hypothetical protein
MTAAQMQLLDFCNLPFSLDFGWANSVEKTTSAFIDLFFLLFVCSFVRLFVRLFVVCLFSEKKEQTLEIAFASNVCLILLDIVIALFSQHFVTKDKTNFRAKLHQSEMLLIDFFSLSSKSQKLCGERTS